jgi:hypothetical protein
VKARVLNDKANAVKTVAIRFMIFTSIECTR